ncbi:MAG: hypothetical protein L0H79_08870 [Intrasporangium sp.]|nr:hypothetical protein [Intrasporangium sp.]MDN5795847.1 hypothetical protein [Intrasporangium sp.]
MDIDIALANERLVADGAYAYVRENPSDLYRVKTNQHAFVEVLEDHLKPLIFEDDDYPVAFEVRIPGVAINPRFNAGRMTFVRNRVPVFAVLGSLAGGDSVDEVMHFTLSGSSCIRSTPLKEDVSSAGDRWRATGGQQTSRLTATSSAQPPTCGRPPSTAISVPGGSTASPEPRTARRSGASASKGSRRMAVSKSVMDSPRRPAATGTPPRRSPP